MTVGDLARLAPCEFLNDNLVDFYLKFMARENRTVPPRGGQSGGQSGGSEAADQEGALDLLPERIKQVDIFTAHFYKKISGGGGGGRAARGASSAESDDEDSDFEGHGGSLKKRGGVKQAAQAARGRRDYRRDPGLEAHSSVARWTKDVDLFSKR